MKHIFALLVLTLSFSAVHALSMKELNDLVDSANMVVDGQCSGTLIHVEKRLVLTNYHCIDKRIKTQTKRVVNSEGVVRKVEKVKIDPVQISQHRYNGHTKVGSRSYRGQIVGYKKERDLALIEIMDTSFPNTIAVRILPEGEVVRRGEAVVSIGNPMMLDASITKGVISSTTRSFNFSWTNGEDLPMLQFTGGIFGGSSGGALIKESTGEMVGVPAAGARSATFIGLAIPVEIVREVMREWCYASVIDRDADDALCRKKKESGGDEVEADENKKAKPEPNSAPVELRIDRM